MTSPSTNQPSACAARAKTSPVILIPRSEEVSERKNSAVCDYQVPYSIDGHGCIKPIGSMLNSTIRASRLFIARNAKASAPLFHDLPGRRAREQNNISTRPSIP